MAIQTLVVRTVIGSFAMKADVLASQRQLKYLSSAAGPPEVTLLLL
jgi:hypothetical protein